VDALGEEQWLWVVGYEGAYEVSTYGRVRSVDREDSIGRKLTGMVMKQTINDDGYHQIVLSLEGKSRTFKVHRLVGIAFIPNPEGKPEINHIDEDKSNNYLYNLEWNTRQENVQHSIHQIEKQYLFRSPEGELIYVKGLRKFCRLKNLSATSMRALDTLEIDSYLGWRSPFTPLPEPERISGGKNPWIDSFRNSEFNRTKLKHMWGSPRRWL